MLEDVKIPKGTWEALKWLAEKRGHSIGETIRHAVNTEIYMHEKLLEGRTILCKDLDGELYQVVFTGTTLNQNRDKPKEQ